MTNSDGVAYGALRPATAPSGGQRNKVAESPKSPNGDMHSDPRHNENESPMPWLRYFFPCDFDLREGQPVDPFYQYFDVGPSELEEDLSIPPPPWSPGAYYRLSFTQINVPTDKALSTKKPNAQHPPDAVDLTRDNRPVFQAGNEAQLKEIMAFCRSVATFKPRTWKDAFPLVDLLRGLLLYLLGQMVTGQKIAEAAARAEMLKLVEEERRRQAELYARQLDELHAKLVDEQDAKLAAMTDKLRGEVGEDLQLQLKTEREEKDKLAAKVAALEAQTKRLAESLGEAQRSAEDKARQADVDRAANTRQLVAKEAELAELRAKVEANGDLLAKARQSIVDALKARTKTEVFSVAMSAIANTMPGTAAYAAALETEGDTESEEDPMAAYLDGGVDASSAAAAAGIEIGAGGGGGKGSKENIFAGLPSFSPGFLLSPLGAGAQAASRPVSAAAARSSGSGTAPVPGVAPLDEIKQTLVFKYKAASPSHAFMVGQKLPYGRGVSWPVAERGTQVAISDVASAERVHFFRGAVDSNGRARSGAYLAMPLHGKGGEVLGMLCVDTTTAAAAALPRSSSRPRGSGSGTGDSGSSGAAAALTAALTKALGPTETAFVKGLVEAVEVAIAADQDALAARMLRATMAEEEAMVMTAGEVDPEPYADMPGGLKMFKSALAIMKELKDADLEAFRNQGAPDDATLAVLRSILGSVGQLTGTDWQHIKPHISRDLIEKLSAMDPQAAWAEWQSLCRNLKPLLDTEAAMGKSIDAVVGTEGAPPEVAEGGTQTSEPNSLASSATGLALARWLGAVRKISSAMQYKKLLEEKLNRANAALMRTFHGDGSSALNELRSYRVPPKLTYNVLQAVMILCGHNDEDSHNWGRMRVLTNYKLIKHLTELRPDNVPRKASKEVSKLIDNIEEDEVRKESVATLSLFRWLTNFTRLSGMA